MNRLYRSFASVSVYPEHGSRAFSEFKTDSNFRYFQSNERGKILARLFVMYRYIKFIKEILRFPHKDSSSEKTSSDHFFHYTNISTLKILLSEKAKDSKLPPRFRVCNCGYMNDVFEGNVFLDKIRDIAVSSTDSQCGSQLDKWNKMVRKYFPHLVRSEENMIPVGKNVYIASLSRNPDSFPLWSIYADNETGCNIEFSKSFFDILEESQSPEQLQDYLISKYTDDDYPVYAIDYLDERGVSRNTVFVFDDHFCTSEKGKKINVFEAIYEKWENVDTEIENLKIKYSSSEDDMFNSAIGAIYAFTSDRINEIRFLFKDADYQYEGEARVVVTTSKKPQIDGLMSPPRAYAEVNRAIDNISVRLGSKIDDATVDQLVTWLKLTGKVREVKLSKRNRRTIDTNC